jgi:hypothetical protein
MSSRPARGAAKSHSICVYFLFVVNRAAVKTAARTYARQLIISCETLMDGGAAPRPRTRRKEKAPAS